MGTIIFVKENLATKVIRIVEDGQEIQLGVIFRNRDNKIITFHPDNYNIFLEEMIRISVEMAKFN